MLMMADLTWILLILWINLTNLREINKKKGFSRLAVVRVRMSMLKCDVNGICRNIGGWRLYHFRQKLKLI